MRISFISQVTRDQKTMTVANDTSLSSTILVLFPEFHPGRTVSHQVNKIPFCSPGLEYISRVANVIRRIKESRNP